MRKLSQSPEYGRAWWLAAILLLTGLISIVALKRNKPEESAHGERAVTASIHVRTMDGTGASGETEEERPEESPVAIAGGMREPVSEVRSIGARLDQARRRIMKIDGAASEMDANRGMTHFFQNPGQGIVVRVGGGETHLEIPGEDFRGRLRYSGAGDGSMAEAKGTRLLLNHPDGVVEWLENSKNGIEQGFELPERLSASGVRMVTVGIGGLSASFAPNGDDLEWKAPDDTPLFSYSGLKVADARGIELAARMIPDGNAFHIMIDDKDAVYPVSVDPMITTMRAKVNPSAASGDGVMYDSFGATVATDGERLVVGAQRGDGSVYVFVRDGANWSLETKILPPDGSEALGGKKFGCSVAINGSQLFIGSSNFTGPFTGPDASLIIGAVHVYTRTGSDWVLTQRLRPIYDEEMPSLWRGSSFGHSLAVDDDVLVIGTNGNRDGIGGSPGQGYVCIFRKTMGIWSEEARLMSPQGQLGDGFGYSVAVKGERIVIGRPYLGAGDAFVFSKQGDLWVEEVKWTGGLNGDRFGQSVAISGDRVAVGAGAATTGQGAKAGSVKVFRKTAGNWETPITLQPTGGGANHGFGSSLAFDGNELLVGAPFCNSNRGGAYLFAWTGTVWQQTASFLPAFGSYNGAAGSSVALKGDAAYAGAPRSTNGVIQTAGVVHHFARSGGNWQEQPRLSAGDGDSGQLFGATVALDGTRLLVGMQEDHTPYGYQSGSAYLFKRDGDVWNLETILMDPDPGHYEVFGSSVAIDGERLVVGNPKDNGGGSAVCFALGQAGWTFDAKLRPPTGTSVPDFAKSVSLEGDLVLVCAPDTTSGNGSTGAGHLFRRSASSWVREAVLVPSGIPGSLARAGHVVLDSGRAYISFPSSPGTGGSGSGCIQEFVLSGGQWVPGQRMVNPVTGYSQFGYRFAVSGNHMVAAESSQRVFAWKLDAGNIWRPNGELPRPEGSSESTVGFGMAVALDGGTAAVESVGRVTIYELEDEWRISQSLSGMREQFYLSPGDTLAIHGAFVAVGMPDDDVAHPVTDDVMDNQGSVFIFELGEPYMRMELRTPEKQVVLADDSRAIGAVVVGLTGPTTTYRIYNVGTIPLSGISVEIEGDDSADFSLGKPAEGVAIPAGDFIEIRLNLSPKSPGPKNATVKISSDDPVAGTKMIHASGLGNSRPVLQSHAYLAIPGKKIVIFLKDLVSDADGDDLVFSEQIPISRSWGTHTIFRDRIVIEVAAGFTGQFPVTFSVTDVHGASNSLSATISSSPGQPADPDHPAAHLGENRWSIRLEGGQPAKEYRVEHSTDMIFWKLLGRATTDGNGQIVLIDHAGTASKGFYRMAE